MTEQQAEHIRKRCQENPAWPLIKKQHVEFELAVHMLPDESYMDKVCHELKMIFEDAKATAEKLYPQED